MKSLYAALLLFACPLAAQVPNLLPHQGRVAVNGVNFDGTGQFKFALVNAAGNTTYWSNYGSSTAGSQPTAAVPLPVTKGLYSVMLGDTALANMTAVPASVFANADLRLRVWFNNGTLGFQQLTPDQRLAPNGYLPDGAVTGAKLADGAITAVKLAPGAMPAAVQVTGASQAAVANTNYMATSAGNTLFTLPDPGAMGSTIEISGAGAGGVQVFDAASTQEWTSRGSADAWFSVASSSDGVRRVAASYGRSDAGGYLFTSSDSGDTWWPRATLRKWRAVASSADGMKLVAVVRQGLIYTSTDAGVTWTPRNGSAFWEAVASSADGTRLAAAVRSGGITTSQDSGVTWSPASSSAGFRSWSALAMSADGMKMAAVVDGGQIYTSSDFGGTWTPREAARNWTGVASSADGVNLAAVAEGGQIYTSTDSGATWTPRDFNRNWFSIASSGDGSKLIAADYGGKLYYSRNAGVVWAPVESDRNWRAVAISADGRQMTAAVNDGTLYKNGGIVFTGGSGSHLSLVSTPSGWRNVQTGGWYHAPGAGYAGLGTAEPAARLHVYGTESPAVMRLQSAATPGFGRLEFVSDPQGSSSEWRPAYIQSTDAGGFTGGLKFVTNGTGAANRFGEMEVMRIQNGSVDVNTGAGRMQFRNEGNIVAGLNVTGGPVSGYLRFRHAFEIWPNDAATEPGRMDIRNTAGAPTITMDGGTGRIGIGRTAAVNRLEIEGDASKAIAGAWLANSDRRIKTHITPVTGALETLEKVKPVTFRYTEEYRKAHPDIKDLPYYNVIAQEFREVFPDAVKSSGEKMADGSEILQVDTYPATITALAAIKELKAENDALKAANQAMEQRLAAIEEMMRRTKPLKLNPEHQEVTP